MQKLSEEERIEIIKAFVDDVEAMTVGGHYLYRRRYPDPFIETEPDENGDKNGENARHRLTPAGLQLGRVLSLLREQIDADSMSQAAKVVLDMAGQPNDDGDSY